MDACAAELARREDISGNGMDVGQNQGAGARKAAGESDGEGAIHADEHDFIETQRSRVEDKVAGNEDGRELAETRGVGGEPTGQDPPVGGSGEPAHVPRPV